MKKQYVIDLVNEMVCVDKEFVKKAGRLGTPEFETFMELKTTLPGFAFEVKNLNVSNKNVYNELDAFCAIAEFFKLNYSNLYHDVISIESKAKILEILKENHRLGSEFKQVGRLY